MPLWTRTTVVTGCVSMLVTLFPIPPTPCPGAHAAEGKIGYVNVAKVFDGYQRTKASDAVLEKKGKQKETEFEGRMNDLKKLRQNLELLSNDAREAKTREIEERTDELQRFRNTTARELSHERDRVAKDILKEIQDGIEQYGKANGFTLIFDDRSLLYGQPGYDLTDELLTMLNSRPAAPPPARGAQGPPAASKQ